MTHVGPTGVLVTGAEPNTPEWYAARFDGIGSSEIAAVLGISPWTSPFDLYWHKINREVGEPNPAMSWGTRLEPVIADAFAAAHPEFALCTTGVIMHRDRSWQRCSPDRLIFDEGEPVGIEVVERADGEIIYDADDSDALAILECKSDNNRAGWGEPGTDHIPPHYLAQVRWQLDTIGLTTAYVAVTFGGPPVEFVVEADEGDAVLMREAARDFLDRLEAGTPPPIDSHTATTRRLKALHPTVTDDQVEIPADLVEAFREAKDTIKARKGDADLFENKIRELLGSAGIGTVAGEKAVSRSVYDVKEHVRKTSTTDRLNLSRTKREAS